MIFYQILSSYFLRKCMEISVENLYVNIGAQLTKDYNTHARSL